jgi:hypothetical protein
MEFLKLESLELNPAGYLINKQTNKPVNHDAFVAQQEQAAFIIKLAEAIKDKNFNATKIDNFNDVKAQVLASMKAIKVKQYVSNPSKPVSSVNDELVKFALDFDKYQDELGTSEKINAFMNQFNVIDGVELVGDYFSEGVVKPAGLYNIGTILEAVTAIEKKVG